MSSNVANSRRRQRRRLRGGRRSAQRARPMGSRYPTPSYQPSAVSFSGPVTADRVFVKLRVGAYFTPSSTVTTDDFVLFANSAFDPLGAEGSSQPAGYDQWAALYENYKVWNCRVTVHKPGDSTAVVEAISVFPSNSSTAITTDLAALSHPFGKTRVFAGGQTVNLIINHSRSSPRQLAIPNAGFTADGTWASAVTTNPSLQWFFHVFMGAVGSGNISVAPYVIIMEQDVEFYSRAEVSDATALVARIEKVRRAFAERKVPQRGYKVRCGTLPALDSAPVAALPSVPHVQTRENACGDTKERLPPPTSRPMWSDLSDDDEASYADFLRWKQATSLKPLVKPRDGVG